MAEQPDSPEGEFEAIQFAKRLTDVQVEGPRDD